MNLRPDFHTASGTDRACSHIKNWLLILVVACVSSMATGAAAQNLSSLISGTVRGVSTDDEFGAAVAAPGDFNLDGFQDLVVGARLTDGESTDPDYGNMGEVVFLWGPFSRNGADDYETHRIVPGDGDGAQYGATVATIGEFIPGAGPAVAVGAPYLGDGIAGNDHGGVWVHYFQAPGDTMQSMAFWPSVSGGSQHFGAAICGADFNGDGYMDLVAGGNGDDSTGKSRVYVFFGGPDVDTIPDVVIESESTGDGLGSFVSSAGLLDSDSFEDIVVSAPGAGKIYVVYGRSPTGGDPTPLVVPLDDAGFFGGVSVSVPNPGAVAGGGDIAGDDEGLLDIAVNSIASGSVWDVYIFAGERFQTAGALDPDDAISKLSGQSTFGSSLTMGGDVNGDGRADLLVAAKRHSPELISNIGRVSILIGGQIPSGTTAIAYNEESTTSRWHLMAAAPVSMEEFGTAVVYVSDIDGDGEDDLVVGAPGSHGSGTTSDVGSVSLITMTGGVFTNESVATEVVYSGTPYSSTQVDYNGDGGVDLYVTRQGSERGLLLAQDNVGSSVPRLIDATFGAFGGAATGANERGVAVADYNNDGYADMFVAHATAPKLYRGTGSGFVNDIATLGNGSGESLASDSWAGAWADYNNDGAVDLFVSRASASFDPGTVEGRQVRLFKNRAAYGQLVLVDATIDAGLAGVVLPSVAASWVDVNGDSTPDLMVGSLSSSTPSKLYVGVVDGVSGETYFVDETSTRLGDITEVSGVSVLDIVEDGDVIHDLVLSRFSGSSAPGMSILANNAQGQYQDVTSQYGISLTGRFNSVVGGNLNLDGQLDLLALPGPGADLTHFERDGAAFWDRTNISGLGLSAGAANGACLADFNNDGDLDLYLGRPGSSGAASKFFYQSRPEFFNDSPEPLGNWLKVRLECGEAHNKSSVGARVSYIGPGISASFTVDGGSGRGGQSSPELTIGLGANQATGSIAVTWPDGSVSWQSNLLSSQNNSEPLVLRDHQVTVDIVNSALSVEVVPLVGAELEWTFEWVTGYSTPASRDLISLVQGSWPGVGNTVSVANAENADVYYDESKGGFVHRYVVVTSCSPCWAKFECLSVANIWDQATSSWQDKSDNATSGKVSVRACFQ